MNFFLSHCPYSTCICYTFPCAKHCIILSHKLFTLFSAVAVPKDQDNIHVNGKQRLSYSLMAEYHNKKKNINQYKMYQKGGS